MSNDWWSTSSSTPHHPTLARSQSQSQSQTQSQAQAQTQTQPYRPSRYTGDELDPDDAKAADAIKFLPSFASSQAGKMALGTSPTGGMSVYGGGGAGGAFGMGSPGDRRSPGGRLAGSVHEANSPRNTTRARTLAQSAAFGNNASGPANGMDEDMPPTASLRDSVSDARSAPLATSTELPTPPALLPTRTTTTLYIFGPPPSVLATLQPYLSQFGPITAYAPGPEGANWYTVEYATPLGASYALRRHGEIVAGRYMVAFAVAGGGSMAGCTLVDGAGPQHAQGIGRDVAGPMAGTPIRIQNAQIMRPKTLPVVKQPSKVGRNEYAWDEPEAQPGWTGWVAERLFGR